MVILDSYIRDMSRSGALLTKTEETELGRRIQAGDESARIELVEKNLRFVINIARRYNPYNSSLTLSDLISVGNMGLIIASHRFDWDLKFRFITYAYYWIRQVILRELACSSRVARAPVSSFNLYYDYMRTSGELEQRLGYSPSTEQVAAEMGETLHRLNIVHDLHVKKVSEDVLVDPADETLLKKAFLNEALEALPVKEREILCHYYGLRDYETIRSYKRIGGIMNLSHEAVRLNVQRGLTKMQKHLRRRSIVYTNFKGLLPWTLQ
jgi:RNA polymerase primary sigma factor